MKFAGHAGSPCIARAWRDAAACVLPQARTPMLANPPLITARREAAGGTMNERFRCWGTDQSRFGAPLAVKLTRGGKVAVFCAFIGAQISAIRRTLPVTLSPYFPPREPSKGTAERPRAGRHDNKGYK